MSPILQLLKDIRRRPAIYLAHDSILDLGVSMTVTTTRSSSSRSRTTHSSDSCTRYNSCNVRHYAGTGTSSTRKAIP